MPRRIALGSLLIIAVSIGVGGIERQASSSPEARVDAVFSRWSTSSPGCAVGVSVKGSPVLEKAYGMADLEHAVANKPDTIFEAGSVSKQFTAAAILLLAKDGKLSLDDPAQKYIPELPPYGTQPTIRHMLTHTSGLRDWGSIAAIGGWPRTTRVHTHDHVLDIVSRQRSLNFLPGTRWSYSNTGYNLAAIIVSRTSGQSFADFTRTRIFEPLGMTRTSWRDDFTRVVKDRATAYSESGGTFTSDMPFENVHGNGGLLTTVGDLLRWTRNLSEPVVGDAAVVKEQQEPGKFRDGRQHDYAFGLRIAPYRSVREVGHGGATAGYRAYLAHYPEQRVSVAVLCNAGSGNAAQYAHAVADAYLGLGTETNADAGAGSGGRGTGRGATAGSPPQDPRAGTYLSHDTGEPLVVVRAGENLRVGNTVLSARSATRFAANGRTFDFGSNDRLSVVDEFGSASSYLRVRTDLPPLRVADYAGEYESSDAEVTMTAAADGDALVLKRRPATVIRLTQVYADGFRSSLGLVRFQRDSAGKVTGFSISQDRVWDLRFRRQPSSK
jgi:CubicO group peptidase (beta-lactamase class C family)